MEITYRNHTISVGATERRDGEMATEACIFQGYQPIHSLYTYIGQEALALEMAQQWVDEQVGAVAVEAPPLPVIDPTYTQRRAIMAAERARLDTEAEEAELQLLMRSAADSARKVERRFFGNQPAHDRLALEAARRGE